MKFTSQHETNTALILPLTSGSKIEACDVTHSFFTAVTPRGNKSAKYQINRIMH